MAGVLESPPFACLAQFGTDTRCFPRVSRSHFPLWASLNSRLELCNILAYARKISHTRRFDGRLQIVSSSIRVYRTAPSDGLRSTMLVQVFDLRPCESTCIPAVLSSLTCPGWAKSLRQSTDMVKGKHLLQSKLLCLGRVLLAFCFRLGIESISTW